MGKGAYKAVKIADRVYWVGAIDWGLRNFHGYLTSRGTTYNAFLILADEITLIDTVKAPFYDEMMARICDVVDPRSISCVVSNHAEMDHSGSLPRFLHAHGKKKLIASKKGEEALAEHFHWKQEVQAVGQGERISLGDTALTFVETRMLHWPDSMFSFLENEGVLFTNDAFGMHIASSERFADELDPSLLRYEAAKYYANILLPLSPIVKSLLEKLPSLDLDVKVIAPDHGPVFRKDWDTIVKWYSDFAQQRPSNKAVVIFDTMWQSTEKMARAICDGMVSEGTSVKVMPLSGSHRSDVATELLDAGALVVGAPTMNNQIYPTVVDAMSYLTGLKPKNLIGASFGSYGWSGESVKLLDAMLTAMKVPLVQEGLGVKYVPTEANLTDCYELGRKVASRLSSLSHADGDGHKA